jgi:hypothetical protein
MEAIIFPHCGLAGAGLPLDALLTGAADGLLLPEPYCPQLASALADALSHAVDSTREQPQRNPYSVFCTTWHADSLARLSDADIANAWRLADYLLLDEACAACLRDVVVQRELRTGVVNRLYPLRRKGIMVATWARLEAIRAMPPRGYLFDTDYRLVRGVAVPRDAWECKVAAMWGQAGPLLEETARAIWSTDSDVATNASFGRHWALLRRLVSEGCPLNQQVVINACYHGEEGEAVWALEQGAVPGHYNGRNTDDDDDYGWWPRMRSHTHAWDDWLRVAAHCGCLAVLAWARARGRLPDDALPGLRWRGTPEVRAWMDGLLRRAAEEGAAAEAEASEAAAGTAASVVAPAAAAVVDHDASVVQPGESQDGTDLPPLGP